MNYRLGKLPYKHDPRTFRLERYLDTAGLPPPPPSFDWTRGLNGQPYVANFPMYLNDKLGDCTIAAAAHMTQLWTAQSGKAVTPTDTTVQHMYYAIGRLENPGQSRPDNGLAELDVLNYWRKHGISGERAFAFAKLDTHNHDHVKQALMLFGGLYIGFGISDPNKLFSEFNSSVPWTPETGTVTEGHAVNIVGYDALNVECITWGRRQRGTWAWWDAMVDEAWAVLPSTWKAKGAVPNFDFTTLQADLQALGA